ncbi:MAG: M48 family metalloprotease [Armatimonadetes bacterium]|nr:M48 family metalloprotease [Armatimonadota bacterium]
MVRQSRRHILPLLVAVAAVAVTTLLSGCDEDDVERTIGHQTAVAVEQEFGVNRDPVLAEWVNGMGQRLVGQSHRQYIEYSFKVVDTDMVNAFAAPWGYIYVTRGLMTFVDSEDEIAFILGHEVGHVANRDAIKSTKKSILFSLGAALLGAATNRTVGELGEIGAGLTLMHYSREDERDADVSGAVTSYGAGYNPAAGTDFFARLMAEVEKGSTSSVEHLFLTHPETPTRINALKKRPELNLEDPAVASHIGRGYARRSAFALASKYYAMALQRKPDALVTRLLLADAYRHQGRLDQARAEYQAVLQSKSEHSQAQAGLAALDAFRPAVHLAALSASERQQAARLETESAPRVVAETQGLLASYQRYQAQAGGKLAKASAMATQSISAMLGFAQLEADLAEGPQKAFSKANAAVSAANDAAFTLESVSKDLLRLRDGLSALATRSDQALAETARGEGYAGDVDAYERALVEIEHAAAALSQAADASGEAVQLANQAIARGADTVTALEAMLRAQDPERHVYPVNAAAESTRTAAAAAQEAAGKIKHLTVTAEARALLARLNLAALGAGPAVRDSYDGMVAYYCGTEPSVVRSLREQRLGFGDIAFMLSGARANRTEPSAYMNAVAGNELIDGLTSQGVALDGPVLLLRLLANALEQEAAARNR